MSEGHIANMEDDLCLISVTHSLPSIEFDLSPADVTSAMATRCRAPELGIELNGLHGPFLGRPTSL